MPTTKVQRHRAIARLIASAELHSQHELQRELAAQGIRTTQATLSRDLAELGVLKGSGGYCMQDATPEPSGDALDALARRLLAGAEQAGNLVVLHTPPGQASALAVQLDRSSMRGVVGTIAGDDCVFVATRTPSNAKELVRRLTVGASPTRRKATA
ncbi:MAG: arginine repressor [Phycisphaerae bacterium]|nr:arginine repressor [Phycisphaerae bacterium]